MLFDNLEGWKGRAGREAQEGGDICILKTDSHCCRTEINTTLNVKQLHSNKKKTHTITSQTLSKNRKGKNTS